MDVNEIFRTKLRAEMAAQDLTPAGLSVLAEMNRRAVTDLLDARAQSPKLSTAYALAKALGVTIDALTGDAPQVTLAPRLAQLLSRYDAAEQEQLAAAIEALPQVPATTR